MTATTLPRLDDLFEPTLDALATDMREAAAAFRNGEVSQCVARTAFERWFRRSCAEGRPPDALAPADLTLDERIRELTAPGVEHDYWLGRLDANRGRPVLGGGSKANPQIRVHRYLAAKKIGRELNRYNEIVETTCREPRCVRPGHLIVVKREKRHFADDQMLAAVGAVARRLGHSPTRSDYDSARGPDAPSSSGITLRFGSWATTLERAGLAPIEPHNLLEQKYGDGDILDALRREADRRGAVLTSEQWVAGRIRPSYHTIMRRFGSFLKAIEAAGLPVPETMLTRQPVRLDPDSAAAIIRAKAAEIGHAPTISEWERNRWRPVVTTLVRYFDGSWRNALRHAGLR